MVGKRIIKTFEYGDWVELTLLEGGEVILEVDSLAVMDVESLNDLIEWLSETSATVAAME